MNFELIDVTFFDIYKENALFNGQHWQYFPFNKMETKVDFISIHFSIWRRQ